MKGLRKVRRKKISINAGQLVEKRPYGPGQPLPLLIEPTQEKLNGIEWAASNRAEIVQLLNRHAAILFHGFGIDNGSDFERFAAAIAPDLLDYVERAAPRRQLTGKVYTSTEYPASQWIPLHHEMSYSHNWPSKLFFFCEIAPTSGGATPFTDDRELVHHIPQEIKDRFAEHGVMYVRNYGEGVDMPWPEVFQTEDKSVVEDYFRRTATQFEWLDNNRLRTRMIRQAFATHPVTGDRVWFNHAHMFHQSNMPAAVREALLFEFAPDQLPRNAFYGNGDPIEDEVVEKIRRVYREHAISFPWQKGDILLLDNFLTAHGRQPFEGERRICVAMAELYTNPDFRLPPNQ